MEKIIPITVAYGDGIGPEIMEAVLYVLKKAGALIRVEVIEVGEQLYNKGYSSGIAADTWQSLERTRVLLKSPITTPQGGGYKSLNVTLRKALGLYANIRPVVSYSPFVETLHPNLDVVIVRENEEDLYAGIEYRHTRNTRESVKIVSETGCRKIIRYAFEYAKQHGRKKVSCFSKDNIMKLSDGLFHQIFNEISQDYPDIEADHYIIDIGTAKLASQPEIFDVIVTSNLFGDIISDVTAELSGSVGMAGSANIGLEYALFEAIHGSAPDIAGHDIANPSGLLNAAIMMLAHIGQEQVAATIENAWKKTLEDGIHTQDIFSHSHSTRLVGTQEFAQEVAKRLGQKPSGLKQAEYLAKNRKEKQYLYNIYTHGTKKLMGTDIFLDIHSFSAQKIADLILPLLENTGLDLHHIASKGLMLWPREEEYLLESDHWCCRIMASKGGKMSHEHIAKLMALIAKANIDFIKMENLYEYDGQRGYSLAQGE